MGEAASTGAQAQRLQHGAVSNKAERENGAKAAHRLDFGLEKPATCRNLGSLGLIFRRHAADGIGDAAVLKRETVVGRGAVGAAGEAERAEGGVEQVAGKIARERSAGAVGAA